MVSSKDEWIRNKDIWLLIPSLQTIKHKTLGMYKTVNHLTSVTSFILVLPSYAALSINKISGNDFLYSHKSLIQCWKS